MKVTELLYGRADFAAKREIIEFVKKSKNFNALREDIETADALLIFSTSKQHTWLVATSERLYCLLDDLRTDMLHINWSINRSKLVDDDKIVIQIEVRERSEFTGLLDIGDHRNWLYTKRLFYDAPIDHQIREMLRKTMLGESTTESAPR